MGKVSLFVILVAVAGPVAAQAAEVVPVATGPDAVAGDARRGIVDGARDGGRTVVGVAEARRRLGRPLDEALAECGEDASCLGRLAGALEAEIWLAEIFDAGDEVPVGLRRIGPEGAEDVGFWAGVPATEIRASLYGVVLSAMEAPPAQGRLTVHTGDVVAEVRVGERLVGTSPIRAVPVSAGAHRVVARAEGYETWSGLVQIRPDREARLEARLLPDVDGGLPLAGLVPPADGTAPAAVAAADGVAADGMDLSPAASARGDRPPPPWARTRKVPGAATWGSLGAGVAAVSVAAAFGMRADAAAAEARSAPVQLDAAHHNAVAQRSAYAANGLYAAGTVALGLGTYLLFRDLGSGAVTDP